MTEKDTSSDVKSIPASELEELFKYRYTDDDAEFMKLKEKPLPPPPIICPFDQIRQRRNCDRNFDRRYDQRHSSGGDRYRGQRHNSPHWGYDRRDRSTSWERSHDRQSNWERGYGDRNTREHFNH